MLVNEIQNGDHIRITGCSGDAICVFGMFGTVLFRECTRCSAYNDGACWRSCDDRFAIEFDDDIPNDRGHSCWGALSNYSRGFFVRAENITIVNVRKPV